MKFKTFNICFGNMRLYESQIKKGRVCFDFVGEGSSSHIYLTGNYIRMDSDGLEFVRFHNDKEGMEIIGVDII